MNRPDLMLVHALAEDARSRLSTVSQQTKKSQQRLKYSMSVMVKDGILSHPHAVLDYAYFGLLLFKVYFKGVWLDDSYTSSVIARLRKNPSVVAIHELYGAFDLSIEMLAPNPSRFNKELVELCRTVPGLDSHATLLNVVTHIYPRSYLVGGARTGQIIIGGDRMLRVFSPEESALINALVKRPLAGRTILAKEVGVHVRTSNKLLDGLVSAKVVRGFKYVLDTEKLGISCVLLFFKLHTRAQEREAELLEYCFATKEIVQASKTVGDWDIEIAIESLTSARVRSVITTIRQRFKDIIQTYSFMEMVRCHKRAYLCDEI